MNYITHRRHRDTALCGKRLNIPYGTPLTVTGDCLITPDGQAVCFRHSENAKQHFSINDDGMGLVRGALTYAIAYSQRDRTGPDGKRQRFTADEIAMLQRDWGRYLRQDLDVILFNDNFFAAPVYDLQQMARALGIKVKGRR